MDHVKFVEDSLLRQILYGPFLNTLFQIYILNIVHTDASSYAVSRQLYLKKFKKITDKYDHKTVSYIFQTD